MKYLSATIWTTVCFLLPLGTVSARPLPVQPNSKDAFDGSASDKQTEKTALENYARGVVLYYKNQGAWSREEADLTWQKVAEIGIRPEASLLNYVILQAALNTGKFEVARKALVALGEIEEKSPIFQTSDLESMAFKNEETKWIVSIADLLESDVTQNTGSGTIVSEDGWILTAAHVVAQTDNPVVVFSDGKTAKIESLFPGNFENDLVLVKVDKPFASSASIGKGGTTNGESIYSIGFPAGCDVPVKSKGTIQAKTETYGIQSIATTLATLPGSSGSGVFNARGELVGIVKEALLGSANKTANPLATSTWLVPLSEIQNLIDSRKTSKVYPLSEREKWAEKLDLWSNKISGKQLFRKAQRVFFTDPLKAKSLFAEAYEKGDMMSATLLGWLTWEDPNRSKEDEKKMYQYFYEASETVPLALVGLGIAKIEGVGVSTDVSGGVQNLKNASDRGISLAQYMLGYCYLYGRGVGKDEREAVKWLKKGAESGNFMAQYFLGICFSEGRGVAKDDNESAKWLKQSAEQGYVKAQNELAICYYKGIGVNKDEKEEVKWRIKAADQGYAVAQYNLAGSYAEGAGVPKDERKAFELYKEAAEQGLSEAQYQVGYCFFDGTGVERNDKEALTWFLKAAEKGNPEAQAMVGSIYLNGRGVPTNPQEALKWYTRSADQGVAIAQKMLGICFYQGTGVTKNFKKAVQYLEMAKASGVLDIDAYLIDAKAELEKTR